MSALCVREPEYPMKDDRVFPGNRHSENGGFDWRSFSNPHGRLFVSQIPSIPNHEKDPVYRLRFCLDEVYYAFEEAGHEGRLPDILTDMRNKDRADQLSCWQRLQVSDGTLKQRK